MDVRVDLNIRLIIGKRTIQMDRTTAEGVHRQLSDALGFVSGMYPTIPPVSKAGQYPMPYTANSPTTITG